MRILIAIWSLRIGGAETFAVKLSEELANKGHDVALFCLRAPHDQNWLNEIADKIRVFHLLGNGGLSYVIWKLNAISVKLFGFQLSVWLEDLYFRYTISTQKFQVVISNSPIVDTVFSEFNLKVRYVIVEHGQYSILAIDGVTFDKSPLLKADIVVSVSNWCKKIIDKYLSVDSIVIYNGYLGKRHQQSNMRKETQPFTFVMIGRGVEQKGWDVAINAFLKLLEKESTIKLLLIGTGPFIDQLKQKFVHPQLEYVDHTLAIQQYIQIADVGLYPSRRYEAFGLAILDFFSEGKPVIASSVGGINEVIECEDLRGGWLINVNDHGEPDYLHLMQLMQESMRNGETHSRFSKDAIKIKDHYDFEKTVDAYEKLCADVINRSGTT